MHQLYLSYLWVVSVLGVVRRDYALIAVRGDVFPDKLAPRTAL